MSWLLPSAIFGGIGEDGQVAVGFWRGTVFAGSDMPRRTVHTMDEAICVQIMDQLKECMHDGLVVHGRSADILKHWSSRLKDDEVSWPEGLSVLRPEYGCY